MRTERIELRSLADGDELPAGDRSSGPKPMPAEVHGAGLEIRSGRVCEACRSAPASTLLRRDGDADRLVCRACAARDRQDREIASFRAQRQQARS